MRCPFDYRPPKLTVHFGVAEDFEDYWFECNRAGREAYDARYKTCWERFLHWLGVL